MCTCVRPVSVQVWTYLWPMSTGVCGCVCTCLWACFLGSRTRRQEGSQSPIVGPEGLGRGRRRPEGPSSVPWSRSAAHTPTCTCMARWRPAHLVHWMPLSVVMQFPRCRARASPPPTPRGADWGCSVIIQAPAACKSVSLSCTTVVSFSRWRNWGSTCWASTRGWGCLRPGVLEPLKRH